MDLLIFFVSVIGLNLFMLLDCYISMCNFLGIQFSTVIMPKYFFLGLKKSNFIGIIFWQLFG
jgi:hypothetical protein